MTPDIERLAKEVGFDWLAALAGPDGKDKVTMYAVTPEQLAKFAALVAEECAKECDARACRLEKHLSRRMAESARFFCGGVVSASKRNAAAIRGKFALSNDKPEAK